VRLSDLGLTASARVVGFDSHTPPETVARFRALGFFAGTRVTVERRLPFHGPIVVRLGDGSFALEAEAAHCITIGPVDQP
jgi:Fe2+ transport system protein FeoA